jgi:predicted aspartyl protease
VVHKGVADTLNIRSSRKGAVKVAGGKQVPVNVVKLSYIQVGPYRKSDIPAVVISPEGPLHYQGLLGMNFLKDLDYSIDFENKIIRWRE